MVISPLWDTGIQLSLTFTSSFLIICSQKRKIVGVLRL